jgi:hypothetical protein
MALKPIKITFNDKDEIVEFEADLTFGETETLISSSVDLTDVTKPKIDLSKYRMNLLTTTIKMLDAKVVKHMLREITKVHPLATYIEDWMETFQVFEEETSSSTQSITTVPRSSGGTKTKLTDKV